MKRQKDPLAFFKQLEERVTSIVEPHLARIPNFAFFALHNVSNLVMLLVLYEVTCNSTSWIGFFFACFSLGLIKTILYKHQEKRDSLEADAAMHNHQNRGFLQDTKPTYNWLNNIIQAFWLNYQAFARHLLLTKIWPSVQAKNPALRGLNFSDFNIGDQAPRINVIEVVDNAPDEIMICMEAAYEGNALVTFAYLLESLNLSGSGTIEKITVNQVKLRIVLKRVSQEPPFVGGVQIFLMDTPSVHWKSSGLLKLAEIIRPEDVINKLVFKKFIYPRRLCLATKIPPSLREKIPLSLIHI